MGEKTGKVQAPAPGKAPGEKTKTNVGATGHATPPPPPAKSAKPGSGPVPGGCTAWGCKAPEKKFSFCLEHYDHFKFGLIKRTGEPVSDYEKKFDHYVAQKARKAGHKVA